MARTKEARSKEQIEHDNAWIAELYLKGLTQQAIAKTVGLSQQMISVSIARIRDIWAKTQITMFTEYLNRELTRIDLLEREYWTAWENSKKAREKTTCTIRPPADLKGQAQVVSIVAEESKSDGDKRWLEGVQWCIDRRCELMGFKQSAVQILNVQSGSINGNSTKDDDYSKRIINDPQASEVAHNLIGLLISQG